MIDRTVIVKQIENLLPHRSGTIAKLTEREEAIVTILLGEIGSSIDDHYTLKTNLLGREGHYITRKTDGDAVSTTTSAITVEQVGYCRVGDLVAMSMWVRFSTGEVIQVAPGHMPDGEKLKLKAAPRVEVDP